MSRSDLHDAPGRSDDRPLALVHGNCQAESLRIMLDGESLRTVAVPPVHELTAADLPALHRWLTRAAVLVSQPVRRGYRGLPIGTADVIGAAGEGTRVVIVPVVRFAGLYPEHVIVRAAHGPSADPPVVPYHSLRTLARAAGRRLRPLTPRIALEIANASVAELHHRERTHDTIVVSDLFTHPGFGLMRTINHPGNAVWSALAARVRAVVGISEPVRELGRPLLNEIHAPRHPAVIEAFGLADEPAPHWRVGSELVNEDTVVAAHLAWYARHPGTVAAGLRRHAPTLATFGMR